MSDKVFVEAKPEGELIHKHLEAKRPLTNEEKQEIKKILEQNDKEKNMPLEIEFEFKNKKINKEEEKNC